MAEQNKPAEQAKKLGVIGLAAIVVSSMVGGGVFSLPQNMAAGASAGALFTATAGTLYGLWLVYAAGLKYLFLAVIFLAAGVPVFIWARKQQNDGKNIFTGTGERAFMILLVLFALTAVYVFARGLVKI